MSRFYYATHIECDACGRTAVVPEPQTPITHTPKAPGWTDGALPQLIIRMSVGEGRDERVREFTDFCPDCVVLSADTLLDQTIQRQQRLYERYSQKLDARVNAYEETQR